MDLTLKVEINNLSTSRLQHLLTTQHSILWLKANQNDVYYLGLDHKRGILPFDIHCGCKKAVTQMFMRFRESEICGRLIYSAQVYLVRVKLNMEHDIAGMCEQECEH